MSWIFATLFILYPLKSKALEYNQDTSDTIWEEFQSSVSNLPWYSVSPILKVVMFAGEDNDGNQCLIDMGISDNNTTYINLHPHNRPSVMFFLKRFNKQDYFQELNEFESNEDFLLIDFSYQDLNSGPNIYTHKSSVKISRGDSIEIPTEITVNQIKENYSNPTETCKNFRLEDY